jgi:hypothetical protein
MVPRRNPFRRISVFIACATVLALLLALASFYLIGAIFR